MPRRELNRIKSKPPKVRFRIGDRFEYDKDTWKLVYMYRVHSEPNVWIHVLECEGQARVVDLLAAYNMPYEHIERIAYDEFMNNSDASSYFFDIPSLGDKTHKTTQQLLKLKKL